MLGFTRLQIVLMYTAFALSASAAAETTTGPSTDKTIVVASYLAREAAHYKLDPDYPATARQFRLSGEVTVEFTIGLDGKVESFNITKGSPMFNAAVVNAIKRWSFTPFTVEGRPTRARSTMTFTFKL